MNDPQSEREDDHRSSALSHENQSRASRRWFWVFLVVGLVLGFEVNVQRMIAGRSTYMLLAFVGAAFGRSIDYFLIGRKLRGAIYLLPLASLILLTALATNSQIFRLKLPAADAPEIIAAVIRLIENGADMNAVSDEIGQITLTEVTEISFDEKKQMRIARAKLHSKLGTEEIVYSVKREHGKLMISVSGVDE